MRSPIASPSREIIHPSITNILLTRESVAPRLIRVDISSFFSITSIVREAKILKAIMMIMKIRII